MFTQGFLVIVFNKDVLCVMDKGKSPNCLTIEKPKRRNTGINAAIPSYDPYIPRTNTLFFDCSAPVCKPFRFDSIIQVTNPKLNLKTCFKQNDEYKCESIRYAYFKNIDKVLFLSNNIRNKKFFAVDCLAYSDGGRVCHSKDGVESLTKLVDTGALVRPKERSVLSQDEFICEQGPDKIVYCDLDPFTPFDSGLRLKEKLQINGDVLLNTGPRVVILKRQCIDNWCGYGGIMTSTRRDDRYDPPGGWVYRCYYANKQQVCDKLYKYEKKMYNSKDFLRFIY